MRLKIMIHYAASFFLAALFLIIINILYMQSHVYKNDELYYFDSERYFDEVISKIDFNKSNEYLINSDLESYLIKEDISLQILNQDLKELDSFNESLLNLKKVYTAEAIINQYKSEETTTFIKSFQVGEKSYTILLFMDINRVNRKVYTYDEELVKAAYSPFWLIGMNIFLLLIISYIFTMYISQPLNRIHARVIRLSKGEFDFNLPKNGIYYSVDQAMLTLTKKLNTAKEERALSELSREEWISNLSHDIKTPLTSIIGYGELLGDAPSEEEIINYNTIILEKGHYIKKLLDDLNLTIRLKHNQLPLELERVDIIAEVKKYLIDILNDTFTNNTISFTHTESEVYLMLDKRLFKRAIVNLINNAFVHNEKGVNVNVHITTDETNHVNIIIDDDGTGLNDEELDHIFTRYYRGSHTKAEGTGLGLAIAKDVVNACKGEINASRSDLGGLKLTMLFKATQ